MATTKKPAFGKYAAPERLPQAKNLEEARKKLDERSYGQGMKPTKPAK